MEGAMNDVVLLAAMVAAAGSAEFKAGSTFRECPDCPEMVVVPAGSYMMGSPHQEAGRGADEGPRRRVDIAAPFGVSRFEIGRAQYEAFLRATEHPVSGNCITDRRKQGDWKPDADTNLRDPGFPQADNHPVACVSWNDAKAYVGWLNSKTGGGYRLLSEAEWEYAARAGSTDAYPWGDKPSDGCAFMNGTDRTFRTKYRALSYVQDLGCDDGALNTAPVGSYRPNAFGIHDMIGNVGEWVEDCSAPSYEGLDSTPTPRAGTCVKRVVRGGSWGTIARQLRVAERLNYAPTDADDSIGIRVAKTLAN
jgi:formylglycine-generating enzyme required for sulfatase activity